MLTQQRHEIILKLLKEKGSITVTEVRDLLDTSESTVRRDITALDKEGKLEKVFGGAVEAGQKVTAHEYTVAQKNELNCDAKRKIAEYAASLIEPDDFVFLDAGTTTAHMIDFIRATSAVFVTNAVDHARRLASRGFKVILVGGELKSSTEAVVGNQAIRTIQEYHFTKGFFGTNGVTRRSGCTTPDVNEAVIKKTAMEQCRQCYVLCDASKFNSISSVTFADFEKPILSRTGKFPGMRRANISSYARRSENKKPTSYTHINCKAPRPCRSFGCRTGAPFTDLFFDFRQRYIWMMILRTMFQKWNFKQGSILGTPVKTGITGCTGMSSIKIRCSNKIFFWQTSVRCKVCFCSFIKDMIDFNRSGAFSVVPDFPALS